MKKILVLSHQGTGFVDKFVGCFNESGDDYLILSSKVENTQELQDSWNQKSIKFRFSEGFELTKEDVDIVCREMRFDACITVWEGYRVLMSYANHQLGANDVSTAVIEAAQDKFQMRARLLKEGVSDVKSYSISEFNSKFKNRSFEKHFIKPRRGLGSLNSHAISEIEEIDDSIKSFENAASSLIFSSFYAENELYIEEYIDGIEVSYEIMMHNGEAMFVMEHEKYRTQELAKTVLEKSIISPSLTISESQIARGAERVKGIINCLGLVHGCYHIEMKLTSLGEWELIEVNPRVGGALIHDSVLLRSGYCLLKSWLTSLTGDEPTFEKPDLESHTYFEVEFAETGRKVLEVAADNMYPKPEISVVLTQPGMTYDEANLEIFVGLHLWIFREKDELKKLVEYSEREKATYLNIQYQ